MKKLTALFMGLALLLNLFVWQVPKAMAADNALLSITVLDSDGDSRADQFLVEIDNDTGGNTAAVIDSSGWTVTYDGADVDVQLVELVSVVDADPLIFEINVDPADLSIPLDPIDTTADLIELSYTQQSNGLGTYFDAGVELVAIASGDGSAELTEIDGIKPYPVSAVLSDENADGKVDRVLVSWSEDVSSTSSASGWSITSASDFEFLSLVSMSCGGNGTEQNYECAYNFSTSTIKTDIGDLQITYDGSGEVKDESNNFAAAKSFSSSSDPVLVDNAKPFPKTAKVYDTNSDGKFDRIVIGFSEPVNSVSDANVYLKLVGSDFDIVPDSESSECNYGNAAEDECYYYFETTTVKTDLGNLGIGGSGTSSNVKDSADNYAGSFSIFASSSGYFPNLEDKAVPVLASFEYLDADSDAKIDSLELTYSEPLNANSHITRSNYIFTNVGNFTGMAFGSGSTDLITSQGASFIVPLGTESSAQDTHDDSIAISTQGYSSFELTDLTGLTTTIPGEQPQAVAIDGASPVPLSLNVDDTNQDYRLDTAYITWSEAILPLESPSGWSSGWSISGANFSSLTATSNYCGGASSSASDGCTFTFSTSTTRTNIGNLELEYTGSNITDPYSNLASTYTWNASSSPALGLVNVLDERDGVTMSDTNNNGKIDRFTVRIDNDLGNNVAYVYDTSGWQVTYDSDGDGGNAPKDITINTVVLGTDYDVNPLIFEIYLDETDPDLLVDTGTDKFELRYDAQGAEAGTDYDAGSTDLVAFTASDIATELVEDITKPIPTSAVFSDEDSDGKLDRITVTWSENINSTTNATDWSINSGGTFANLSEVSVSCGATGNENKCIYDFTTSTVKTDIGDLQLIYNGTSVTDGTNAADPITFTPYSYPPLTDGAAPAPGMTEAFDTDADGRFDKFIITMSEEVIASSDPTSSFYFPPPSLNFSNDLSVISAECNTENTEADECHVYFSTSTVNTDPGEYLAITFNNSSEILRGADGLLVGGFTRMGNSQVYDRAAPVISTLTYQDEDSDGKIDTIELTYSEGLDATSNVSANDLVFTDTGDFSGISFDNSTSDVSSNDPSVFTLIVDDETAVQDTFDDSGNLAISTQNNFKLLGNRLTENGFNDTLGPQSQITVIDGAAPVITDFRYEDDDSDGIVDQITASFSEDVADTSTLALNDLSFTNVGDFTGASFSGAIDLITSSISSLILAVSGVSAYDTIDDSGNLAMATQNSFELIDASGNPQSEITQPATYTDGAAPTPVNAEVYDSNGDGKLDLITVVFSEEINSIPDAKNYWSISSTSDFTALNEGIVECNSGSAASNECDYHFTTSTVKTDIGDLTLNYTGATSVTDGLNNTAPFSLTASSSPILDDKASPVFVSAVADSDININITMSEAISSVTFGSASAWTASGITATGTSIYSGTIDLAVSSLNNPTFTATNFAYTAGISASDIQDANANSVVSFTGGLISDGQGSFISASDLIADESECTGTSGYCIVGDVITFTWDSGMGGSNDISEARANISNFGGSVSQLLYDNGSNGDETAWDGVFTYAYTVQVGTDDHPARNFTVSATDLDGNTTSAVSSTDTAPIDNQPSTIITPGILEINNDLNSKGIAEIGDTVIYTCATSSGGVDDDCSIDLTALTGNATAVEAMAYVVMPGTLNSSYAFTETITDAKGNKTEGYVEAISVNNATSTGFSSVAVTLDNYNSSSTTDAIINFKSGLNLPADGKIEIIFPATLDVSGVTTLSDVVGMDGDYTLDVSGQTVTITRDGLGSVVSATTPVSFNLESVLTPSTGGATGTFSLTTKDASDIVLSSDSTIPGITIIAPAPVVVTPPVVSSGGGGGGGGGSYSSSSSSGTSGGSYIANLQKAEEEEDDEDKTELVEEGGFYSSADEKKFTDTTGHWAEQYIERIAEMGVVQGKSQGIYAPNDNVTRAELIKIAMNAFGYSVSNSVDQDILPDVKSTDWFAPFIQAAFENNVIFGFAGGLQPNAPANRGMSVTILSKAAQFDDVDANFQANYNKPGWTYARFPDVLLVDYFAPFVAYFFDNGIINGYEDGTFGPSNPITRAEIAKIVVNLIDLMEAEE